MFKLNYEHSCNKPCKLHEDYKCCGYCEEFYHCHGVYRYNYRQYKISPLTCKEYIHIAFYKTFEFYEYIIGFGLILICLYFLMKG